MSDLSSYLYPHYLLLTCTPKTSLQIHYFCPDATLTITTSLSPSNLKPTAHFNPLGTFHLPTTPPLLSTYLKETLSSITSSIDPDFTTKLSTILPSSPPNPPVAPGASPEPDPPGATEQPPRLPSVDDSLETSLYVLTAFSSFPHPLLSDPDSTLQWRWHKPSSPYVQAGQWRDGVERVVEDAEWNSGRGWRLLVRVGV
ncbi:hypothetical protein BDZ85DRAFT_278448 [Elsinoe ampelina]|uniref:Uncharacterized protein n=1 Tax=Elsinoe ampelina TaxID=302913 RepID=A0A6A6GLH8_9PEZI|nr:hypothetical protein BDZ85DRAFT_278448 [Elsinoe ampelina]